MKKAAIAAFFMALFDITCTPLESLMQCVARLKAPPVPHTAAEPKTYLKGKKRAAIAARVHNESTLTMAVAWVFSRPMEAKSAD